MGFEQVVKGDTTYVLFDDPAASFAIDMLVKFYEFNQSVEEASVNIEKNERLLMKQCVRWRQIGCFIRMLILLCV